jgi:prevent-host-death family protein
VTKEYSIAEVRNQLSEMVHQAEVGENITLTRRGRPVAVLVAFDKFQRLITRASPNLWHAIQEFRDKTDFTDADLPDEEVASWRDREPGRNFSWRD